MVMGMSTRCACPTPIPSIKFHVIRVSVEDE
jgi:hypothetical protein